MPGARAESTRAALVGLVQKSYYGHAKHMANGGGAEAKPAQAGKSNKGRRKKSWATLLTPQTVHPHRYTEHSASRLCLRCGLGGERQGRQREGKRATLGGRRVMKRHGARVGRVTRHVQLGVIGGKRGKWGGFRYGRKATGIKRR
jgi:hypothetical protein